jgi:hypothetical protein
MAPEPRVPIDLHLHTALSPCAAGNMTPPPMLFTAEMRGLRVVGVVDHSSAGNARAVQEAAQAFALRALVGLEVESTEGVHLLALFDTAAAAERLEALVAAHQPPLRNRPDIFGEQLLVNEWGDVTGQEPRLLALATDWTVEEVADLTRQHGGLSIAAHVDRSGNGLLPILGFVPPRLHVTALEVSRFLPPAAARRRWPELRSQPLLTGSDAHCLEEIGCGPTLIPVSLAEADLPVAEWGRELAEFLRAETAAGDA